MQTAVGPRAPGAAFRELGDRAAALETVRGVGYRLRALG